MTSDNVNSYFYPLLTTSLAARLRCRQMPEAETGPYLAFGAWLRERREAARLKSQPQAELKARKLGLKLINQGKLSHLERGMNGNPDPEFLNEIAQVYGVSYEVVVARWIAAKFGLQPGAIASAESKLQPHAVETTTGKDKTSRRAAAADDAPIPQFVRIPVLKDRIAAGQPLHIEDGRFSGYLAFREDILKLAKEPICLRVGPSEHSMTPRIMPSDVVLVDTHASRRTDPKRERIYAVNFQGGTALKYVEVPSIGWIAFVSENREYKTAIERVEEGSSVADFIVGEVVWHGQYIGSGKSK